MSYLSSFPYVPWGTWVHGMGTASPVYVCSVGSTWVGMEPAAKAYCADVRVFMYPLVFLHQSASWNCECLLSAGHCAHPRGESGGMACSEERDSVVSHGAFSLREELQNGEGASTLSRRDQVVGILGLATQSLWEPFSPSAVMWWALCTQMGLALSSETLFLKAKVGPLWSRGQSLFSPCRRDGITVSWKQKKEQQTFRESREVSRKWWWAHPAAQQESPRWTEQRVAERNSEGTPGRREKTQIDRVMEGSGQLGEWNTS